MPFYDIVRQTNTNATPGTETTHLAGKSAATAETMTLMGMFCAGRFGTAGGGQLRCKTNTAGGTATTPTTKNVRAAAAQTTWVNDNVAITAGTTLIQRLTAGFAQTGGQGGYVPVVMGAGIQLLSGATPNPVDIEFTTAAVGATVPIDILLDILEGSS